ncbi:hypothetical protein BJ912DRAFT_1019977 [Pholiota molesta]|nr:hypothetical protein BJ912DRAFT_1019977 [Pholiota molesta]
MHACSPVRSFLHFFLFACSSVLLGLTAYRVHYTKALKDGDILTSSSHFYDPIIVELLVTSCLAIIFCLWLSVAVLTPLGGPLGSFASEHVMIWIIWVMFLVGAAITTHKWNNLKWCRGSHRPCRILETIKAFSWICWGISCFVILASASHLAMEKTSFTGAAAGGTTRSSGYGHSSGPDTRQVNNPGGGTTTAGGANATHPSTAPNPVAVTV